MAINWLTPQNCYNYDLQQHLRNMGQMLYNTDVDSLIFSYNGANKIVFNAIVDYKHGAAKLAIMTSAIKAQIALADTLKIPFFIVYYYIDKSLWTVPMFYVKPINDLAREFMSAYNPCAHSRKFKQQKEWMSEYEFSRFNYIIRRMKFYPSTTLCKGSENTIDSLSKFITTYPLPQSQGI